MDFGNFFLIEVQFQIGELPDKIERGLLGMLQGSIDLDGQAEHDQTVHDIAAGIGPQVPI